MNKEKLNFKESCEFYCNYHKVSKTETAMICGNLGIVVDRLLKSQREEIVEEIEKIRSNTIGCGDVLDDLKNLITKEDITDNRRTT